MSILIGLIPAIGWGLMPVCITWIGGKPSNQIWGTAVGALAAAGVVQLCLQPEMTPHAFGICILSGMLWICAQLGQYTAIARIGVSRTLPVSTGLQLIGTTLVGVFVFHEWKGVAAIVIGFAALGLVIGGIWFTTLKDGGQRGGFDKKILLMLILTNFGFVFQNSVPAMVGKASGFGILVGQAVGIFLGTLVYVVASRQTAIIGEATSWKNSLSGLLFAIAAMAYIVSAGMNGIATGFVLTQLGVIIATFGGIVFLKERKTRYELVAIVIGLVMIVTGSCVTVLVKS